MNFDNRLISLAFALAGLFLLGGTGCGSEGSGNVADEGETYEVVATVGMITDVARNIAGEHAEVSGIIGEGTDPHLYTPRRSDVIALKQADVVFYNGLLLEGKMTDVLVQVARTGKPVAAVTEAILGDEEYLMEDPEDEEHTDPHVWMDVQGWMRAVPVIVDTLSDFDPEHAEEYEANAEAYLEKLKELDAYAADALASIPKEQRVLVTAHDAFNYLGRAYGVEVRGIQGLSTESEAGVRDIENLISYLAEREIPAVFVETSVADKNVRALVEGTRAQGHDVEIGGALFSDAMGPRGTYEGTYIGMIDHNVTTIARALGGEAPEDGFQGKLSGFGEKENDD
ncbi:MAG: metal ABC transporter solute-binding protein, Zn/Mn family [Opitutales bacterium]